MTASLKEQTAGPIDRLKAEARELAGALGSRALASVQQKVQGATGRLTDYVEGGGGPGLMAAVTGAKDLAQGKGPARSLRRRDVGAEGEGARPVRQEGRPGRRQEAEAHQHRRVDRRGGAPPPRVQPVDPVPRLRQVHEEGRERRPDRR